MTYEQYLQKLIEKDNRYMVMTAENRAMLRNIPPHIGNNFVDVGIAEMTLIGSAAGFALRGRKPIAHALAAFITMRSFEHVRTDVGIPDLPVKVVGFVPGFLSTANGATHQAIEDVGLMAGIPNVGVFTPSDVDELLICLPKILESDMPMYIRYNDALAKVSHSKDFEIGKAEVFGETGDDVTIITYGLMLSESHKAMEKLNEQVISTRLLNLRTVKPFDKEAVLESAKNSKLLVTVEDHFEDTGFFSMLSNLLIRERISVPVMPVALKEKWFRAAGSLDDIMEYEGFKAEQIVDKVRNELKNLK